jgi:hypothetical protein
MIPPVAVHPGDLLCRQDLSVAYSGHLSDQFHTYHSGIDWRCKSTRGESRHLPAIFDSSRLNNKTVRPNEEDTKHAGLHVAVDAKPLGCE